MSPVFAGLASILRATSVPWDAAAPQVFTRAALRLLVREFTLRAPTPGHSTSYAGQLRVTISWSY